jgi:hypothetical protein
MGWPALSSTLGLRNPANPGVHPIVPNRTAAGGTIHLIRREHYLGRDLVAGSTELCHLPELRPHYGHQHDLQPAPPGIARRGTGPHSGSSRLAPASRAIPGPDSGLCSASGRRWCQRDWWRTKAARWPVWMWISAQPASPAGQSRSRRKAGTPRPSARLPAMRLSTASLSMGSTSSSRGLLTTQPSRSGASAWTRPSAARQ